MNSEKIKIIGKDLSEEEKKSVLKWIKEERVNFEKTIEGECEKTELETKIINLVNKYLKQELADMGLEYQEIKSNQLHILSLESFEKNFPKTRSNAFYHSANDQIYIRRGTQANPLEYFKQILHESIHLLSFQKFLVDKKSNEVGTYRVGYTNTDQRRGSDMFRGLNEAVVDRMAMDITFKNNEEILSILDVDKKKQTVTTWYPRQLEVLDIVLKKIAIINKEDVAEIWKKFKFGELHGDMMYLRNIEKVLGRGGLRVIAMVPVGWSLEEISLTEEIIDYLNTDDKETREKMAQKILDKRSKKI